MSVKGVHELGLQRGGWAGARAPVKGVRASGQLRGKEGSTGTEAPLRGKEGNVCGRRGESMGTEALVIGGGEGSTEIRASVSRKRARKSMSWCVSKGVQ